MKKFLFATFMGVLVALVGCQQDDELTGVENTLGKKVSVTANIKANAQSRVAMEYVTEGDVPIIKVDWKESGESFLMYDATDSSKKTIFTQTSGNQFEGELPSQSGEYMVQYGSDEYLSTQDGTLNEKYVWMYGEVTDLNQPIEFKHATTVLKPKFLVDGELFNKEIEKIEIEDWITVTPDQIDDIFIFFTGLGSIPIGNTFNFTVTSKDQTYKGELTISKNMEFGQFYTADINLEKMAPYVTFTAEADQKLKYTGTDLQYSTDGINFEALEANKEIHFGNDVKLYLRGVNNLDGTKDQDDNCYISFENEDVPVACTGDIRTLIDYETYETVETNGATFISLFAGCYSLTSAPALPATKLAKECYSHMFAQCYSLEVAPDLPATVMKERCYDRMFNDCDALKEAPALQAETLAKECFIAMFSGCDALTEAPVLKATEMAEGCYQSMFSICTALEKAPALPATELALNCYAHMFANCTSLTSAPALPAETLAENCYISMFSGCKALEVAPELKAAKLELRCYQSMFYGCTSLTSAPEELPATTLADSSYETMFYGCTSLKTAPELRATTLANECCFSMFQGCTSLETAPALRATTLVGGCYAMMFYGCEKLSSITMLATGGLDIFGALSGWVDGVAAKGTLTKAADATLPSGKDGIPTGWDVVNQ